MKPRSSAWILAAVIATVGSVFAADRRPSQAPAGQIDADTREFANQMAIAGLTEVQLGKMASQQASDPGVKAFGQMMVKDHSAANAELTRIAKPLGITLPTEIDAKHKELVDKLSMLKGAEFDREYINAMVQGHEEVANKLRARASARMTSSQPTGGALETPPAGAPRGEPKSGAGSVGTAGKGEQALTQWAVKALPRVEKHLERARELQRKSKA